MSTHVIDSTSSSSVQLTNETATMSTVNLHEDIYNCTSNSSSPGCDKSGNGISLVAPLSMMTLGVMGNIIALVIIYTARAEVQGRRTVFFVMLTGLAWTEIMAQVFVSPIAILVYINNLKWIGGAHLCRYHGFVMTSFGLVTPLIVCCMSIERFMSIRFSYFYASHVTKRKAQVVFIICLIVPAVFSSFPFLGFGSYELQYPSSWCFLNFHRESTVDAIYAGFFSCINIIAILIMLFCNISVVITLFIMRRSRTAKNSPSFDRRISVSQISNGGGAVIRSRKSSDMEAQMIWFLCLISTAFSVCYLPFNVHILGNQFTGKTNHVLDLVFLRMLSCNQILDPWLYVIFRKSSFMRFLRYIRRIFKIKRSPSDELLNEALKNDPRKRSLLRSSTVDVTMLNRTVGNGSRVNTMDDNLEQLKKILENERKLGRQIYSRISERTEYSESTTQHEHSTNQDCQYGSVRSRDYVPDSGTECGNNIIHEGDIINDLGVNLGGNEDNHSGKNDDSPRHRPCTITKSCPTQGSEPVTLDHGLGNHPFCRQLSMPTPPHSFEKKCNASDVIQQSRPIVMKSSSCSVEKVDPPISVIGDRHGPNYKFLRGLNLGELSESNDEVFLRADTTEQTKLCPEGDSTGRNPSQSGSVSSSRKASDSSSHNTQNSLSESQELLS